MRLSGRDHIEARAEAHGVTRDGAETELGNVLDWLERPPADDASRRALALLYGVGVSQRIAAVADEDIDGELRRLCRHALFLEVECGLPVFSAWTEVAPRATARVEAALLATVAERKGATLADVAFRLTAGAAYAGLGGGVETPAAARARRWLDAVGDAPERAAHEALVASRDQGETLTIVGAPHRARAPFPRVLAWVTGWRLLTTLLRAGLWIVGARRRVSLSLSRSGVEIERTTSMLGRVFRRRHESVVAAGIVSIEVEDRARRWPLYVGFSTLVVCAVGGTWLALEAGRADELPWALVALAFVAFGVVGDVLLDVLVPAHVGHVRVHLRLRDGRTISVDRVEPVSARALSEASRSLHPGVSVR